MGDDGGAKRFPIFANPQVTKRPKPGASRRQARFIQSRVGYVDNLEFATIASLPVYFQISDLFAGELRRSGESASVC